MRRETVSLRCVRDDGAALTELERDDLRAQRETEVDQRIRVVLLLEARGRIERDVVIDELAEVGVTGGDIGVVAWILPTALPRILVGSGAFEHVIREAVQALRGRRERRKRSEHPTESTFEERREDRRLQGCAAQLIPMTETVDDRWLRHVCPFPRPADGLCSAALVDGTKLRPRRDPSSRPFRCRTDGLTR